MELPCKGCRWRGSERICHQCKNHARSPVSTSHVEPAVQHELEGKKQVCSFHTPCNITVHSKRKRLADPDGISFKAVIDGLRNSGILQDDSAAFVREVRSSQEKFKVDETVITIEWRCEK